MNEKLEKCCGRVSLELKAVECRLAEASKHVVSVANEGVDSLDSRLETALSVCEEKREEATAAGHRIRSFVEEKKEAAVSRYEDWKTDREIKKIEDDADQREDHAVDAIIAAAFALQEAEVAIVEALRARKIAIEVAG